MQHTADTSFSKIRSYVWPIYRFELKKLLPMLIMLTFVCFNYTILRNLKDALVVTPSGAEVLPFIKVWVILPIAVLTTIGFTYLSNHFSRRKVFYIIISGFLVYFALFLFVIYPIHESLYADKLSGMMQSVLPAGCSGLISMVRIWPLTMFYVIAEMWSTMVLSVLFWGFANEITRINEATRFYSALNIGSNASSIIAGQVAVYLSSDLISPSLSFFGGSAWEQALSKQLFLVMILCVGILAAFHWMTKHVLNDPAYMPEDARQTKKEKKLGFRQSISYLANSNYLLCIAAIVVSYNLVIHMVEVLWKDQLRLLYPDPKDYNVYTNNLTSLMGIISTTASLVMVGIIRKLGWAKTALITPVVLLTTTVAFFACLLADGTMSPLVALLGTTPLALAVFVGSLQNCFTKAAKYSLFDATKEMAFIPLAPEHKLKGKAAIDGIGSRLGKSGGSVIHTFLLILFSNLSNSTPYVAAILLAVIAVWIIAVRALGVQFNEKTHGIEQEEDDVSEEVQDEKEPVHATA
jgi:AAA family ATP:ADP antiporter